MKMTMVNSGLKGLIDDLSAYSILNISFNIKSNFAYDMMAHNDYIGEDILLSHALSYLQPGSLPYGIYNIYILKPLF